MSDGPSLNEQVVQTTLEDGLPCARCGIAVEPSDNLYSILVRGLPYGFTALAIEHGAPPTQTALERVATLQSASA